MKWELGWHWSLNSTEIINISIVSWQAILCSAHDCLASMFPGSPCSRQQRLLLWGGGDRLRPVIEAAEMGGKSRPWSSLMARRAPESKIRRKRCQEEGAFGVWGRCGWVSALWHLWLSGHRVGLGRARARAWSRRRPGSRRRGRRAGSY